LLLRSVFRWSIQCRVAVVRHVIESRACDLQSASPRTKRDTAPKAQNRAGVEIVVSSLKGPEHVINDIPVRSGSTPPEVLSGSVCAPLVVTGERSRKCLKCRKPLTGRKERACSGPCRAALSRLRQAEARAARDQEIRLP